MESGSKDYLHVLKKTVVSLKVPTVDGFRWRYAPDGAFPTVQLCEVRPDSQEHHEWYTIASIDPEARIMLYNSHHRAAEIVEALMAARGAMIQEGLWTL